MMTLLNRFLRVSAGAFLLCVLIFAFLPQTRAASSMDETFNTAVQSYVAGRLEESMMYLKQVLTQNPSHERARKLLEEVKNDLKEAGKPVEDWEPPKPDEKPAVAAPHAEKEPQAKPAAPDDIMMEEVTVSEETPAEKQAKPAAKPPAKPEKAKKAEKTEKKKTPAAPAAKPSTKPEKAKPPAIAIEEVTVTVPAAAETQQAVETVGAENKAAERVVAPAPTPAPAATGHAELITVTKENPKEEPVPAPQPAVKEIPEAPAYPALRFGSMQPPNPDEPSVYGIDVYGDPESPIVFIHTTDGVDFLPNPIASPPTMAVDLPGAVDRLPAKKSFDVKHGPIVRIKHSQYRTFPIETARVSIELRKGSEQPVVEQSKTGGYWVRFGGAQVPDALAAMLGAPVPAANEAPAEPSAAAPAVEIGPQYVFTDMNGFGQSVAVNQKARPLSLKVIDAASAQPVANLPVTFEVAAGDGSLSGAASDGVKKLVLQTTSGGIIEAPLAIGKKVSPMSIKISAGDPAKFNLLEMTLPVTVTAGAGIHIEKISGDLQEAVSGDELPQPLTVRVTDADGNPVPLAKVQFTILKGNGRLDAIRLNDPRDNEAVTDSQGLARCEVWVLGVEPGEQLMEARLIGTTATGEHVLFSAQANQRIVSLDFKDAVVIDIIRTLSQLGNMNVIFDLEYDDNKQKYIVPFLDPLDPKGKITKVEIPPLTIHVVDVTVLEAMDMVLESAGLTRVLEGNTIRIIAKQRALGRPLPVQTDTTMGGGGKFVTHVFKLQYTDAENIQKLLTQFVEREGGDIIADPLTNQIMVVQTADNVKRVGEILDLLDVPYARAKETNLEIRRFQVANVSVLDMADRLATILSGPGFEFTLIGSDLTIKKKGTVDFKTSTLHKSTKTGGKGGDAVTEDFLKQTLTLNVLTINPVTNVITVLSTREILSLVGQVIESLDVKSEFSDVAIQEFKLRYLNMEEGMALVKRYMTPKGTYKEFADISTILVNDSRDAIQNIESALSFLDRGVKKLAIYKFKYLDPQTIQQSSDQELINRLLEADPGGGTTTTTSVLDRRNQVQVTAQSVTEPVKVGPGESWWMIDAASKTLIIFDSPRNVEKVIGFIKRLDEANLVEVEYKTYTLKYAQALDVYSALKDFLINPGDVARSPTRAWTDADLPGRIPAIITLMAKTNTLLAVVSKTAIEKLDRLVERLDIMNPSNPDLVTRTIFLKAGSAANIAAGLRIFLTQDRSDRDRIFGIVNADPASNSIVFLSTSDGSKTLEDMIQKMDVPAAAAPATKVKVYQLKNVSAEVASPLITNMLGSLGGVSTRVGSIGRSNLIAVTAGESLFPQIDDMVDNIDVASPPPPDMMTEVFYLNNAKPSDIAGILQGTLSQDIYAVDPKTGEFTTRGSSAGGGGGLSDKSPASPTGVGLFLRFSPDDRLNALTVVAPPAIMKIVAELIRKLDQRAPQVLIDASILEYTLADDNSRGINFITQPEMLRDNDGKILDIMDQNALSKNLGAIGTEFNPGTLGAGAYRVILNSGQMRLLMEALMKTGKVEVLATPKITALNNKPAVISAGTTKSVPQTVFNASGVPAVQYKDIDALLKLTVVPTISNDRSVNLTIALNIDEFAPGTGGGGGSSIDVTKRSASSSVLLGDNQTLVLGGVIKDRRTTATSAVPVLKDIPVIGNLFKSKREQTEKTELMIFITPRVITNLPEATQVTKDIAKSLQQITPFPVNINTSSVAEISDLTGLRSDVDPEQHLRLAQRIVARREQFGPYQSLEQLLTVPGLTRVIFDDVVYRIEYKADVNVVSLQELVRIKGITLGMAQKIVEERRARGIFRSEDEFESLLLANGMNKGFYDRFLRPIIVVQAGTVGNMALAPEQSQRLPVAPESRFTEPTPAPEAIAPAPRREMAPAPAPTPTPTPERKAPTPEPATAPVRVTPATRSEEPSPYDLPRPKRSTQTAPIVVPAPEPRKTPAVTPAPEPTQKQAPVSTPSAQKSVQPAVAPPPAPTQKKSATAEQPAVSPAPAPQPTPATAPAQQKSPAAKEEQPYDASLPMPEIKSSVTPGKSEQEQKGKVDINTASTEDLMKLPGIDEYRAKMIDAYRYTYGKFKTVSDIKQVPDITDEIYDQIKDKIIAAP